MLPLARELLEAQRAALEQERGAVAFRASIPASRLAALEPLLRARIAEWRDLLRAHGTRVAAARRALREILVKRAVLTTETSARGRFATLTAELSLGRVFSGLLVPKLLVAPRGTGRDWQRPWPSRSMGKHA
jgi:hypothetical protein